MKTVTVDVQSQRKQYPIYIESGLLQGVGELFGKHLAGATQVLVITDTDVADLYLNPVLFALQHAGCEVHTHIIPAGEPSKSLSMAETVYNTALNHQLSRNDVIVALGGGVVGDLAGFCAATYLRGIPFVQIPTTLLAQVDSSVGGKVAVNYHRLKNGVGSFYQPRFVLIDPDVLKTLPESEWRSGLGEVVKYGLIEQTCCGTQGFFNYLEAHALEMATREKAVLSEVIARCCEIKASVVMQDETEQRGIRYYLNLGHTFAHALEEITRYQRFSHGEAVAIGMIQAAVLAEAIGLFPQASLDQMKVLYEKLGLPTVCSEEYDPQTILALMRQDKKAHAGRIRLVLPYESIGKVMTRNDIADEVILSVL